MIDTICKDMEFCIQAIDDILTYGGNTKAEQQAIVEKVLQECVEHALAVNLLKSKFPGDQTIFSEDVINGQEVKMHALKCETMPKWPILAKTKVEQVF